jgi:hypothetical protein
VIHALAQRLIEARPRMRSRRPCAT